MLRVTTSGQPGAKCFPSFLDERTRVRMHELRIRSLVATAADGFGEVVLPHLEETGEDG